MLGAFFEIYVISEVLKSYYNVGKRPPVYYYRDTDGKEIDLILEQNDTLYPIEITPPPQTREEMPLKIFKY